MKKAFHHFIIYCILSAQLTTSAQKINTYEFTVRKEIKTTPVKNQDKSGTCWAFSTCSFLESEILRKSGKEYDLSEMHFVYHSYLKKAEQYVRFHGNINFSQGGQAHDVLNVVKKHGFVTEEVFSGKVNTTDKHNHAKLETDLLTYLNKLVKEKKIALEWKKIADSILQSHLGKLPEEVHIDEQTLSPVVFSKKTGINPHDYIEITSYSHHPFYQKIILEVPDNWALEEYYNIPIEELIMIMDTAIYKGYTIVWDGDISEKGYANLQGIAIIPDMDWANMTESLVKEYLTSPHKEMEVTQKDRQVTFDNHLTTDDHLMHIVGIAKDQNNTKYYFTKNSWGSMSSPYNGNLYMSESFVKLKTIAILVHKDIIPYTIAQKLGF